MPENQNIEWKESWRDEYLKWICGFANADGGKIIIGKDDKGNIVGVKNPKRLLEDIPNKVRDILGILVDVNLHESQNGNFIEINVEAYPYPVNYKGQYHYRSGSTKQELKEAALDKFMLQKKGKRWDGVPIPNITTQDLKSETFDFFRKKAVKAQRIDEDVLSDQLWIYQLESMVLGNTKPSICCGCHGWRIIALLWPGFIQIFLLAILFSFFRLHFSY